MLRTIPGTDTKLTPEIEDPIMPMATTHHGDFRLPKKKASLSVLLRLTKNEISNNIEKYNAMIMSIIIPDIDFKNACKVTKKPFKKLILILKLIVVDFFCKFAC
jgi:hypothetical protein